MLPDEFSAKFDVLLNSYNFPPEFGDEHPKFNPALNEYEKSVFLTKAEMEFFVSLYNGTSIPGVAFEITEESRRYLEELVRTKTYDITWQCCLLYYHHAAYRIKTSVYLVVFRKIYRKPFLYAIFVACEFCFDLKPHI